MTTQTPQLRFSEFSDNWEVKKLGDLLEFKNGINADKEQYGSGAKFINVLDILNNDYITHDKIIGSVNVDSQTLEKYLVSYGDILFQRSSETREEVGTANVYLDETRTATFGGFVIRGKKIGEYNPVFLNKLLKTDSSRDNITSKSGGSTRYNVGQETLSSVTLLFPKLPEQTKIANFLTAIDEKIQALKQKKTLLEQYKKGVMQGIFSSALGLNGLKDDRIDNENGKEILKSVNHKNHNSDILRFKNDDGSDFDEWEEKSLGEVATFSKGKGVSKKDIDANGEFECIRYGELYTHYKETIKDIISKTNMPKKDLVLSEYNDVIIPASGETQIDIATASCVLKSGVALGGDLNIIKTKLNGVFLSYYLNNAKKQEIASLAQGISVVHLYSSQLQLLELNLPSLPEQQKIANFLSAIDEKIEKVSQQISTTEKYKKGLLQQMFC